jgi:hypothetical protein
MEVFFSYAHEDEALRDKLAKHLKLLERQGVIKAWHDRNITAGEEWKDAIDNHLESANVILLLVSSDFLASDYCYDIELKRALERHESNEARVIPIILRSVDWHGSTFGKLTALPKDGKAITSWSNEDEAFTDVVKGLRRVIDMLQSDAQETKQLSGMASLSDGKQLEAFQRKNVGRRDKGLIGWILDEALSTNGHPLAINKPSFNPFYNKEVFVLDIEDRDFDTVYNHVQLLAKEGLIEIEKNEYIGSGRMGIIITGITMKGHDYIDNLKSEDSSEKTVKMSQTNSGESSGFQFSANGNATVNVYPPATRH